MLFYALQARWPGGRLSCSGFDGSTVAWWRPLGIDRVNYRIRPAGCGHFGFAPCDLFGLLELPTFEMRANFVGEEDLVAIDRTFVCGFAIAFQNALLTRGQIVFQRKDIGFVLPLAGN